MSKSKEYKEKLYKIVKLPSGIEFKIKAVGPLRIAQIMSKEGLTTKDLSVGSNTFNKHLLVYSVVDPILTLEDTDDEDKLSVLDLTNDDATFLINEIIDFSKLRKTDPLPKQT